MDELKLVEALCARSLAQSWDAGRLDYPAQSGFPFQQEAEAILAPRSGLARPLLVRTEARLQEVLGERLTSAPSHLAELAQEFELPQFAAELLLVIAAPMLRGELARLYGIIANDPARPLCDEFLLGQIFSLCGTERSRIARELDSSSPLLRFGLVHVGSGPRPFASLTVDPLVIRRLQGDAFDRPEPESGIELCLPGKELDELLLPERLRGELRGALGRAPWESLRLVVRGRQGSGRRTTLAALCSAAGRSLGMIGMSQLAPFDTRLRERLRVLLHRALLRGWLPCIDGLDSIASADADTRSAVREVIQQHPGLVLFRCSHDLQPPIAPGYLLFDIPPLTEAQRIAVFEAALARNGLPTAVAASIGIKYRIGPGIIEQVVAESAAALVSPALPGGDRAATHCLSPLALEDKLEAALRQRHESQIGHIATRVTRLASWDQVVLPSDIEDSIYEFIGRVRHRGLVYERWGMDKILTSARGLTALFQGGPGTGKSMVAGLIARELGYELFRVDLSRIISKWIGETEQNLAKVFDVAEDGHVIILFDEADALFTKRMQVSTSVDRYSNAEVNYLLQRLDSFEGIAVLTTNQDQAIDKAFKRRLSINLEFPFPDEDARERLWQVHLPDELPIDGPLDLRKLARAYELSGGYIRNAVLRAAFLAAMEEGVLTQLHLERAVRLEYRERGKLIEGGLLE